MTQLQLDATICSDIAAMPALLSSPLASMRWPSCWSAPGATAISRSVDDPGGTVSSAFKSSAFVWPRLRLRTGVDARVSTHPPASRLQAADGAHQLAVLGRQRTVGADDLEPREHLGLRRQLARAGGKPVLLQHVGDDVQIDGVVEPGLGPRHRGADLAVELAQRGRVPHRQEPRRP